MTEPASSSRRLLHVTTVPLSLLRFLSGQVGYMQERGFMVFALSSPGPLLSAFAEREGVQVHAVDMPRTVTPARDLRALRQIVRHLREIRPHIVHAHTPKAGLLAMLAAAMVGVPVRVYHIHGLPLVTATGKRKVLLWLSDRVACALAHRVICVGPSVLDTAARYHLCSRDKMVVFGKGSINGIDAVRIFNPSLVTPDDRARTREDWGVPAHATVIGFVGRVVRDKGISEMIGAWRILREAHPCLHLAVIGPREDQDPIASEDAALLDSDPRVHMLGYREVDAATYAALDILALPTYREGLVLTLLEAAAMEIPAISTRIPGCMDAVEDGKTALLVPSHEVDPLLAAINTYLCDPALAKTHARAARRHVLEHFQPSAIWEATYSEYQRLLIQRPSESHAARSNMLRWLYVPIGKRAIDVSVSLTLLILLGPLLALIAGLVRVFLGSPVLFQQERPGLRSRPFVMRKFRTMTDALDDSGNLLPDDLRLTQFGRLLRSTSLDELPELIAVLRGDMSLVGPRPLLMRYLERYTPDQARRHDARPGMTGLAQVRGRNALSWEEKFALDLEYVETVSLQLDLRILWETVRSVLRREGISQEGRATAGEFLGNDVN